MNPRRGLLVFLVLAVVFLGATIALPLWFTSAYVVDLADVPIDVAGATELTLGVLLFPIAMVAGQLICEHYGARRALLATLFATLAGAGIVIAARRGDLAIPAELALALVACTTLANLVDILVFAGARRALDGRALWLRSFVATPVALLLGWAAFVGTWTELGHAPREAIAMASAPSLYGCACAAAGIAVLVVLAALLRGRSPEEMSVGGDVSRTLEVEDTAPILLTRVIRRAPARPIATAPLAPFTAGELAFFAEGDEMGAMTTPG